MVSRKNPCNQEDSPYHSSLYGICSNSLVSVLEVEVGYADLLFCSEKSYYSSLEMNISRPDPWLFCTPN